MPALFQAWPQVRVEARPQSLEDWVTQRRVVAEQAQTIEGVRLEPLPASSERRLALKEAFVAIVAAGVPQLEGVAGEYINTLVDHLTERLVERGIEQLSRSSEAPVSSTQITEARTSGALTFGEVVRFREVVSVAVRVRDTRLDVVAVVRHVLENVEKEVAREQQKARQRARRFELERRVRKIRLERIRRGGRR